VIEHVFSEGARDWFIRDFHHHEVRDAGKNANAGYPRKCIRYASHFNGDEIFSFLNKLFGHVKTGESDSIGHGVDRPRFNRVT
jgi:hypothetical protein